MRRRRTLDSLQRLADFAADAASREVGERLRALRAEEERLRQVDGFVGHYDGLSGTGSALSVGNLRGRRAFAARLRDAAGQQRQAVADSADRYRATVDRWRDARAQALALHRFNERIRERIDEDRERREQRALDEMAQRRR